MNWSIVKRSIMRKLYLYSENIVWTNCKKIPWDPVKNRSLETLLVVKGDSIGEGGVLRIRPQKARPCVFTIFFPWHGQLYSACSLGLRLDPTGDGSVSYTDLNRNKPPSIVLPMLALALVDPTSSPPPFPSSVGLAFLWSSSVQRTPDWTMVRLSAADAFDHKKAINYVKKGMIILIYPWGPWRCNIVHYWS